MYLKFAYFDKIKPYFDNLKLKLEHKIVLTLTNYIDKQALQIARYHLISNFKVKTMQNTTNSNEDIMLRAELELLMKERATLLIIAGAAAGLIAELNTHDLPVRTVEAADLLATTVNKLSEETLQDALNSVHASIED